MKTFDWTKAETLHRPEYLSWLKVNFNKPVTEEEYVTFYQSLRESDPRPHKAGRYYLKHIKNQYATLKDEFGFFV